MPATVSGAGKLLYSLSVFLPIGASMMDRSFVADNTPQVFPCRADGYASNSTASELAAR
jgi:hypothetical protein